VNNIATYEQLQTEGYYGQCGQDKLIIETLFPGKTNGVFVDIGANDGVTFSNTYLLEKLGWSGLVIEPIPSIYEQLSTIRECITVSGCVSAVSGKETFRLAHMLFENHYYNNINDLFRYCDATVESKKKDTKFIFLKSNKPNVGNVKIY